MLSLIGIAGLAGAGKDTLADYLVRDYGFTKYSYAMPIKQGVAIMLGINISDIDDRSKKERPMTNLGGKSYRQILQEIGTDYFRKQIKDTHWIELFENKFRTTPNKKWVIPDIRFENETAQIRRLGGLVIHLQRPDNPFKVREHESERILNIVEDKDEVIVNKSFEQLQQEIEAIIRLY